MSGRDLALMELDALELPGWPAGIIRGGVKSQGVEARDRALGERIFAITVKNLLLLQYLIEQYSHRRLEQVDGLVQKIIAVGLAQLRFLDRVPASAVVDEAVKQARRFGRTSAAGFVNAVLRNATRTPDLAAPKWVALSHPMELFQRMAAVFGEERAVAMCQHNNSEPPTLVRLYRGVDSGALGAPVQAHQQPGIYVVEGAKRAMLADWAGQGIAQVQDATAAAVVPRMDIHPGHRMLDRCCGLGTKTLQIRDILGETGSILAVDPSGERCEILRGSLRDRKIENVEVSQSRMISPLAPAFFDRVLVDAPCSNSGVLARRPEARYSQTAERLASLARLQDEILGDTAGWLRPGGLLVYSTCSLWPQENEERIAVFLKAWEDYELVDSGVTLPGGHDDPTTYHDGGYWALLRRR